MTTRSPAVRTHLALAIAATAVVAALAGCSSAATSTSASSASSTSSPSANAGGASAGEGSGEPVTGVGTATASGSQEAWTRGTHATITNDSGGAVQIGAGASGNSAPDFPQSALAVGASVTADDGRGGNGSAISARVTYPDGKKVDFRLVNPVIGTPEAEWREASPFTWADDIQDYADLDEGESTTATVAGHAITITRLTDDDNNKNWTVTLA